MKKMVIKNCLICENPINRGIKHSKYAIRRGPKAVTCSKPCAKIYRRIYNYIYGVVEKKLKK